MSDLIPATTPPGGEFLFYQSDDGRIRLQVRLEDESVWLTQAQLSELFQRERSVITKHISNVFKEGELEEQAVCANFARTAADGKTYRTAYYNLDVIISVGYRVKSHRGTQFRIWATQRLREYIVIGFTMDDERLSGAGFRLGGEGIEETAGTEETQTAEVMTNNDAGVMERGESMKYEGGMMKWSNSSAAPPQLTAPIYPPTLRRRRESDRCPRLSLRQQ